MAFANCNFCSFKTEFLRIKSNEHAWYSWMQYAKDQINHACSKETSDRFHSILINYEILTVYHGVFFFFLSLLSTLFLADRTLVSSTRLLSLTIPFFESRLTFMSKDLSEHLSRMFSRDFSKERSLECARTNSTLLLLPESDLSADLVGVLFWLDDSLNDRDFPRDNPEPPRFGDLEDFESVLSRLTLELLPQDTLSALDFSSISLTLLSEGRRVWWPLLKLWRCRISWPLVLLILCREPGDSSISSFVSSFLLWR